MRYRSKQTVEALTNRPLCECGDDWNGCPRIECGAQSRVSANGKYNPYYFKKWYCGEVPCAHVVASHECPRCPVRYGHSCRCAWDDEDWADLKVRERALADALGEGARA